MSLRTRLLAGLIGLAAVGLVVMGVVTYAEQRSFLFQRLDQQAVAARNDVSRDLDSRGINVPGTRPPASPPGAFRFGRVTGGEAAAPPGPPVNGAQQLPPGSWEARRDASGATLGEVEFSFRKEPAPKLPAKLPITTNAQQPRLVTVGSTGNSGVQYRVLAFPTGDQPGTTIVAVPQREADQTLQRLLVVEALVAAGVLLALATLGWLVVRAGLRPLDRMGRTAGAIAAGDLSQRVRPATERTEVGRLGVALNAMLGQIEQAFAERRRSESRLRRFVADASHELRTPLASIRGYAELFRLGAAREPADVAKAMRRIEDEAARMGVLVEDLLTLARLDQLPATRHEPVDLTELVRDAGDDARATAPDRRIDVRAEGPAVVLGDVHQLRQVVANLTRNALVHTPPGTPVELSLSEDGGQVRLEVRDHGPGLPDEMTDAVFERFWRAEPGRGRGPAGAGLGLAIVAAVVSSHGGTAEARNPPGGGAAFTITLARADIEAPA